LSFFNDPATTQIYTLSLHDALPISREGQTAAHRRLQQSEGKPRLAAARRAADQHRPGADQNARGVDGGFAGHIAGRRTTKRAMRSEEHTSELQSRRDLVCRLLLEKK